MRENRIVLAGPGPWMVVREFEKKRQRTRPFVILAYLQIRYTVIGPGSNQVSATLKQFSIKDHHYSLVFDSGFETTSIVLTCEAASAR